MRMTIGAVILGLACSVTALAEEAGYGGQQRREIKALAAEEQAGLAAGRGMGLARAAELNHYPGPAHVLEHEAELGLTPEQAEAVRRSRDRMGEEARAIGGELIERERALDAAFRNGTISAASLAQRTGEIGILQGRLRAVHLTAHLEMRKLLSSEQIATYDKVRGYAGGERNIPAGHAGMHPD